MLAPQCATRPPQARQASNLHAQAGAPDSRFTSASCRPSQHPPAGGPPLVDYAGITWHPTRHPPMRQINESREIENFASGLRWWRPQKRISAKSRPAMVSCNENCNDTRRRKTSTSGARLVPASCQAPASGRQTSSISVQSGRRRQKGNKITEWARVSRLGLAPWAVSLSRRLAPADRVARRHSSRAHRPQWAAAAELI